MEFCFQSFIENTKCDEILGGRFLSSNNNAAFIDNKEIMMVKIVAKCQGFHGYQPIAIGALHKCSNNQGYFMIKECSESYLTKAVTIESYQSIASDLDDRNLCFEIKEICDNTIDYSTFPPYVAAFGDREFKSVLVHIYDQLVEFTISTVNMDLIKNITIDLQQCENENKSLMKIWRDEAGFIVTDGFRYYEVIIDRSILIEITQQRINFENSQIIFDSLNSDNLACIHEYETTISLFNRETHIDNLLTINNIQGVIAFKFQQPVGYILMLNDYILQCYADSPSIANGLIEAIARMMDSESVIKMHISSSKCDQWICDELLTKAADIKQIYRHHTRALPNRINWEKVFVLNIGLTLF